MKELVWPAATYGCESWTPRKNEETRLDAYEMKGLRKILWVSLTEKKTNERNNCFSLWVISLILYVMSLYSVYWWFWGSDGGLAV